MKYEEIYKPMSLNNLKILNIAYLAKVYLLIYPSKGDSPFSFFIHLFNKGESSLKKGEREQLLRRFTF